MKKYTLTALVLTMIAGICAALIAVVNLFTADIIKDNNEAKKAVLCQEIFEEYDADKSVLFDGEFTNKNIKEKIEVHNSNGEFIGYIYTVSGSNAYGAIELLVGISDENKLEGVRFINNGQSFSSETATHLDTQYNPNMTLENVLNLDLSKSDVTAGATYAAKLIRDLVSAAFEDAKGGSN